MRLVVLLCSIGILVAQDRPRFADYPAEPWVGPAAEVIIQSRPERTIRTRLREAGKEPANFAGHYNLVRWGCGSNCVLGAIVDLQTGEVFPSPFGYPTNPIHWNICQEAFPDDVYGEPLVDFRKESRLLVIRCGKTPVESVGGVTPEVYYFEWNERRFRLLLHVSPDGSTAGAR